MAARRVPRVSPRRDGPKNPTTKANLAQRSTLRALGLGSLAAAAIVVMAVVAWGLWSSWVVDQPRRLRESAEAATRARDWPAALIAWKRFDKTGASTGQSLLIEAKVALALDRAADASKTLERAARADPSLAEVWQLRLDLLRVLDRPLEALRLGRLAESSVGSDSRSRILAATTLAALADLPDDEARSRLSRWIAADSADLDARVAYLARVATNFHPGDPDRASRIATLTEILRDEPDHIPAREALVIALASAGEPTRGRLVLEAWPEAARDARFDRLRGRWDLDYDHRADRAAEVYARTLAALPHDWKSHYGLARAYRALGRDPEARTEAEAVARLRERLDPVALGPRLASDLARLDDPQALLDLSQLSESVGLTQLAQSWNRQARSDPATPGASPTDR